MILFLEVKMANQEKKPNFFVRMGGWFRKSWSEIRKVNWPTFPEVVKDTGIVLMVCLFFLVIIGAIDFGLGQLLLWLR
jgi:preprotein translocase subunit SecE